MITAGPKGQGYRRVNSFPRTLNPRALLLALALLTPLLAPTSAHSQGCSQCREQIGQTPPQTRTAYRRAILLMLAAGTLVFTGSLVVLKRFRQP